MIVKKGEWYFICCSLDLDQAEEDEEFEDDDKGVGLRPTVVPGTTYEEALAWMKANVPGLVDVT